MFYTRKKYEFFEETIPGGDAWKFVVAVCHPVRHILTLFQTKKFELFSIPFSET